MDRRTSRVGGRSGESGAEAVLAELGSILDTWSECFSEQMETYQEESVC